MTDALGETNIPTVRQLSERNTTMGDRSPKSVQKQAMQKQAKNKATNQQKQQAVAAKQSGNNGKRSK